MDEEAKLMILGEEFRGELKAIRELVSVIPDMNERLTRVEGDVVEMKGELVVHRKILKDLVKIVGGHAESITELKTASHTHA